VDIAGGEAEKSNAGVQQSILTAIVLQEVVAVSASLVFHRESLVSVVEIWAAQEATTLVVEGNLRLGSRKSCQDEEHA